MQHLTNAYFTVYSIQKGMKKARKRADWREQNSLWHRQETNLEENKEESYDEEIEEVNKEEDAYYLRQNQNMTLIKKHKKGTNDSNIYITNLTFMKLTINIAELMLLHSLT